MALRLAEIVAGVALALLLAGWSFAAVLAGPTYSPSTQLALLGSLFAIGVGGIFTFGICASARMIRA